MSATSGPVRPTEPVPPAWWVGGVVTGALLGALTARWLWQQAQVQRAAGGRPWDARQGLRVALIVLKALRQLANLGGA